MKSVLILAIATAATLAAALIPALAGDIQGDAYDCSELWLMRNQIYKNAGYCFATPKAITYFGNGGCSYHTASALPLSGQDRLVLHDVKRSERRQGC